MSNPQLRAAVLVLIQAAGNVHDARTRIEGPLITALTETRQKFHAQPLDLMHAASAKVRMVTEGHNRPTAESVKATVGRAMQVVEGADNGIVLAIERMKTAVGALSQAEEAIRAYAQVLNQ